MGDIWFGIIIVLLLCLVFALVLYIRKTQQQIKEATAIVQEIAMGNLDRRLIISEKSPMANLCYTINDVVTHTKAELVNNKQAEFTYRKLVTSLSHDIRTPLASLTGYLEAIQLGIIASDEMKEYISISLNKSLDLKYYVDTLFDWLKLESGEQIYHFTEIDVFEYAREVIAAWIPQFEKNKIDYTVSFPNVATVMKIDKEAFKRIFDNLLQNILTHSCATQIALVAQIENQKVCFKVQDNGIGISATDLPHIFERLYKCNVARGVKGNGLGLSIVKELTKGLHGEISANSNERKGTEFLIYLPLSPN